MIYSFPTCYFFFFVFPNRVWPHPDTENQSTHLYFISSLIRYLHDQKCKRAKIKLYASKRLERYFDRRCRWVCAMRGECNRLTSIDTAVDHHWLHVCIQRVGNSLVTIHISLEEWRMHASTDKLLDNDVTRLLCQTVRIVNRRLSIAQSPIPRSAQSWNVKRKNEHRQLRKFWFTCRLCSEFSLQQAAVRTMEEGVAEGSGSNLTRSEDEIALQGCCSPKKTPYRFLGLALMCLLGFGMKLVYNFAETFLFTESCAFFVYLPPRCPNDVTVKRNVGLYYLSRGRWNTQSRFAWAHARDLIASTKIVIFLTRESLFVLTALFNHIRILLSKFISLCNTNAISNCFVVSCCSCYYLYKTFDSVYR